MISVTKIRLLFLMLATLALQGCAGWASWDAPNHRSSSEAGVVPDRMPGPNEVVVRRGDTVYAIAFRHNLDVRSLARWNGIGADYLIHPGEVLRLKAPRVDTAPKRQQSGAMQTRPIEDADRARVQAVTAETPAPVAASVAPPVDDDDAKAGGYAWVWPVNKAPVVRGFGQQGSKGVDFGGVVGQPVFAAAPGRVVYSGNALKGYGELIIIKHDEVYLSAYGYNSKRYVKEGDIVTAGQPIAEMGLGPENKPMLHFEIRQKGEPISPAGRLPARTGTPK